MNYDTVMTPADISSFTHEDVKRFLEQRQDIMIHKKIYGLLNTNGGTWFLQKIS
jgi:hypothetical protein